MHNLTMEASSRDRVGSRMPHMHPPTQFGATAPNVRLCMVRHAARGAQLTKSPRPARPRLYKRLTDADVAAPGDEVRLLRVVHPRPQHDPTPPHPRRPPSATRAKPEPTPGQQPTPRPPQTPAVRNPSEARADPAPATHPRPPPDARRPHRDRSAQEPRPATAATAATAAQAGRLRSLGRLPAERAPADLDLGPDHPRGLEAARQRFGVDQVQRVADVDQLEHDARAEAVGSGERAAGRSTRAISVNARSWRSSDGMWWSIVKHTTLEKRPSG